MKGEKGIIPARMAFNPQTIGNHMRFRGKGHGSRVKGHGSRVKGQGSGVQGPGYRVQGPVCRSMMRDTHKTLKRFTAKAPRTRGHQKSC